MTDRYQLLPPLTDAEYAALRGDIEQHGVLVPIVYDQHGNVLDGHHRLAIVRELGIETYPTEVREVADDDAARRIARTLNLNRRHLTREQKRALIAAEVADGPDRSDREIGRLMGCDHKTVGSVRRELAGELPHPEPDEVTSEAELGHIFARTVESIYRHADEESEPAWAAAVQTADLVVDWGERRDLPNTFWFPQVIASLCESEAPLAVWDVFAAWIVPVATIVIEECDVPQVRALRGDRRLPAEDLARFMLAVWSPPVDDEIRTVLFDTFSDRIAMALAMMPYSRFGLSPTDGLDAEVAS